ncbi:MAG: TerB N-terminal domain-containing protein [Clostridia bacterium]|nr:TerB N-terminal domain-containing protein [Clostridia bacterium]
MDQRDKKSLDEFWDIEKLLPQKKQPTVFRAHTYDTKPVEVIVTAKESTSDDKLTTIEMRPSYSDEGKLSFFKPAAEPPKPSLEYSPNNPFIKSVKIYKRDDFGYYSAFYDDGIKYLKKIGTNCDEPSFFSYVPQYSQLNPAQLNFYFYMRNELRSGHVISASYSYILLYIFELLNIHPDKEHALWQLCFVWQSYREKYMKLDPLMKEWITDFCLINQLLPSAEMLGTAHKTAIETASLKELYICAGKSEEELFSGNELVSALLELCTNYDWKKSKYATAENIPLYEKYIPEALRNVLASMKGRQGVFVGTGELKRDAFAGAICTPNTKCRIEVSYCSIARSHEMRFLISDVIKHTENRIRSYIGVKSKLTVYSLPVDIRKCIDSFMDENLGGKRAIKKQEEIHEYDKLYDAPKREFSLENAKLIEETSWQTTQILVEAFEDEGTNGVPDTVIKEIFSESSLGEEMNDEDSLKVALEPYMDFISAALACDASKQAIIAKEKGRMTDSLADEINEIAADIFGDIILEKDGSFYAVIEDYREVFE